jgi:hypothetical protein
MNLFGDPAPKNPGVDHEAENRRIIRELARVTEERDRWCQTDENSSQQGQRGCPLCRAKGAPLSKSGGAVGLEIVARVKVTLLVGMV